MNNSDKHRLITVLAVNAHAIQISGLFGKSTLKAGVRLHPNAKVGHVLPLPDGGIPVLAALWKDDLSFGLRMRCR